MQIQLLYFKECPNYKAAYENLIEALNEMKINDYKIEMIEIKNEEDAVKYKFLGSPTLRIEGRDVDLGYKDEGNYVLACRVYKFNGRIYGMPLKEMIEIFLKEVLK